MKAPYLLTAPLEQALNGWLALDPYSAQRLQSLRDGVVELDLQGTNISLYLFVENNRLRVTGYCDEKPDAIIRATPLALARLALINDKESALFGHGVTLLGDTGLATRMQKLLADADIDWEEHLSRIIGDIAAHQLGRMARTATEWGRDTLGTASMNSDEYLHEELRATPPRREVETFLSNVDEFRAGVERATQRVQRLLNKYQNR
jgi:ubiquinone biosynthesis protein UbiJ